MRRAVSRTMLSVLIWTVTSALTVATDADEPASAASTPAALPPAAPAKPETAAPPAPAATAGVSFVRDLVPVLRANCATCHLTGSEAGNLALHPGAAYKNLVGVQSIESKWLRVKPGAPDESYMLMKIDGTHLDAGGSGGRMPYNMEPLDAATRGKFRDWSRPAHRTTNPTVFRWSTDAVG